MGVDSFDKGTQNPWGLTPNDRAHDYAYQYGQQQERQRQIDLMSPPKMTSSAPVGNFSFASESQPPRLPRAPEKSFVKAVLASTVFGPFGTLYASRIGGIMLLGGIGALSVFFFAAKNYGAIGDVLSLAVPVSVACSVAGVKFHNAKARAYNAKLAAGEEPLDWIK